MWLMLATGLFSIQCCGQSSSKQGAQMPDGKLVFDPRDYGAVGDGTNLDSPAINRAIEACSGAGGGMVYLRPGTYLCGSIHLKSHINLCLGPGSVILGAPQELHAYDPAEPVEGQAYQDGGHTYFHNSLIWGENLTDVSITGTGMINGGGLLRDPKELDHLNGFFSWGKTNVAPAFDKLSGDDRRIGNKAICLKCCRGVLLRDFTIYHGGHFGILATGCDRMTIDNLTIDTNRDGMDIDCCRNVMVSNCRVNSPGDDGICPKSSYALGSNVITENLTIVNCQVSGFEEGTLLDGTMKPSRARTGRIKFGTEANGGFRNCTVANCTFRCCRGLALEEVDGGILENITINNISMMDIADYGIYITLGNRNRGPAVTEPSRLRNILISDIVATGVGPMAGIEITGTPGNDIESVRLENIRMKCNGGGTAENAARVPPEIGKGYPEPGRYGTMPGYGVYARHVHGLELANVTFTTAKDDQRPAIVTSDVDGLEIDNFKAQLASGVAASRFEETTNLVIRNSPVLEKN